MSFLSEFKEFAVKGNVVDMAVGVIIGGAFGKIVSSVVADLIMPLFAAMGGLNTSDLKIILKEGVPASEGVEAIEPITWNYGAFIQNVIDFLIVAICIFCIIKAITKVTTKLKKEEIAEPEPEAAPAPTKEEILLTEIRDLLKEKK